ncbi:hypothetical protein DFH29DRAFT_879977 [Suillus ampliporus]|nr:hypothetical protein DFH29DRAFT_879977 [Suillus ampliporus]
MTRPATCPGNTNKHPRQIVLNADRMRCPKEVIAAKKNKKAAKKSVKAAALDSTQKQVAAKEDVMAIEQTAQHAGPGRLIRPKPKPRPVTKKPASTLEATKNPETSIEANLASENVGIQKKKSTIDDGKFCKTSITTSESLAPLEGVGAVGNWAKSVASKPQLKPSAQPSTCGKWLGDDAPEEFGDSAVTRHQGAQTINDAPRGKKCTLSTVSADDLGLEELRELQEDKDANEDLEYQDHDVDEDIYMVDQQEDIKVVMLVSVMETDDQKSKFVKTEKGHAPRIINLKKKEKLKNAHLPPDAQNSQWRGTFIPTVMYWVGNSSFPWTIPDSNLTDTLYNIYKVVYKKPGYFEDDDGCNYTLNVLTSM